MLDRTDKATKPPKNERWSALENKHHEQTVMLLVSGVVQVGSTNMEPRLTEASGGLNAALILDLTIETADHPGTDVLVWKQAKFSRRVRDNEYREVRIRWAGTPIARCRVLDDDQAHAQIALHTQAANEKAKVTTATGKAKKATKAVVEAVGNAIGGSTSRKVGTAVAVAVGTAAVAGAALMAGGTKSKSKTAAKTKSKAKAKTKTKAKTKGKAKTTAKAKKTTKTKAASKKKAAPKKSAKGASKKTRNVKKARSAKKRSTKK